MTKDTARAEIVEQTADKLMQDFYLSSHYDPKAARSADTVKAAIAYTLLHPATPPASAGVERFIDQLERLSDWLLSNDIDMKLPDEIDTDPRDIANWLRSQVWAERAAGQWHPGDEA